MSRRSASCGRSVKVTVWGRSSEQAEAFAARVRAVGLAAEAAPSAEAAVDGADIICTTTAAPEPILASEWVADGAHINAVGSSRAGPAEIDQRPGRPRPLLRRPSRGRARPGRRIPPRQGGGPGRRRSCPRRDRRGHGRHARRAAQSPADVTIYKSLGSIVQDLAAARHIVARLG